MKKEREKMKARGETRGTMQLIFPISLLINPYLSLYIHLHVLVVVLFFQSNEPLDRHIAFGSFHNNTNNSIHCAKTNSQLLETCEHWLLQELQYHSLGVVAARDRTQYTKEQSLVHTLDRN